MNIRSELIIKRQAEVYNDRLKEYKKRKPAEKMVDNMVEAAIIEMQKHEGVGSPNRKAFISQRNIEKFKEPFKQIAQEIYKNRMPQIGLAADDEVAIKEKLVNLLTDKKDQIEIPDLGQPSKAPRKIQKEQEAQIAMLDDFISAKSDMVFKAMVGQVIDAPSTGFGIS